MGNIDTSVAGVKKCDVIDEALGLFSLYIQGTYSSEEVELICNELKAIARRENVICNKFDSTKCTYTQVQDALSKINEKQSIRKSKGVYYTPNDVVRFILTNSIKSSFGKLATANISDMSLENIPYRSFCCDKTVFDPTCGAGEYLLTALEMKIDLLKNKTNITKALFEFYTRIVLKRTIDQSKYSMDRYSKRLFVQKDVSDISAVERSIHLMPYCIPDIIIRDNETQNPVAVIDAKYKPNAKSVRADTHQLLSYVLLTGVRKCGFAFPGSESKAKIMHSTETAALPLSVNEINYYELILGNDTDNVADVLTAILL